MEITQEVLREKIKNGEKVLVEFHAVWCGPCKMMKPIFERIAEQNNSDVQLYTMDIDKNRDIILELGVRSVPTTISFANGSVQSTNIGLLQEAQINGLVNNLING